MRRKWNYSESRFFFMKLSPIQSLRTTLTLSSLLLYKYEKDYPKATPCNLRTLKHFIELLATTADSLLEEKLTIDTVRGYSRRFTLKYERDTGIYILEQVRKSITNVSAISRSYYCLVEHKRFNVNGRKAYQDGA